jgi:capsular exopolysaccharide synthesis family protein
MSDFVELRRCITIVLKWWWLLILATVLGAGIGYWVSQLQPRVYKASTALIVGQSIEATVLDTREIQASERLALTYASIALRQPVLQGIVDRLNLAETWQELKARVSVVPVEGTQLLEITVVASSPEEARVTADELAHQLILQSPTALQNREKDEAQSLARQRLEDLQAKISAGQAKREELEAGMSSLISIEQVQELQAEINDLDLLITNWENNFTELWTFVASESSPNSLEVVEPAQASPEPVRPRVKLNTLLAGMISLLLALGFIFLVEYLDNTLKSADDLSQLLGLTVLGTVGRIEGKQYQEKVIASHNPFSPVSEAYRMIRGNIRFMSVDRPAKIIMVTSPMPGEGKSTTAANLGVVMAQAGLKTIIIDADLRQATQHQIFQIQNLNGLTDLLCSPELKIEGFLKQTKIPNLYLIPCGVFPPNPSELLGSQRMGQLLDSLKELSDVVIFDSPPVVSVSDAAVLSHRVDGVVLVIKAKKTRQDMARQAILNLQQAGAHILGAVLNHVSKKEGGYYYRQTYSPNRTGSADKSLQARPQGRWKWLPFK